MEALVVGHYFNLAWPILHLLRRAGFEVDVVMPSAILRHSRFSREIHTLTLESSVAEAAVAHIAARGKPYDWVIPTDDETLGEFAALERRLGRNLHCLPLIDGASREHIYSKTGLSRVLAAAGIPTPDFRIADGWSAVPGAAEELGYPVVVKIDASGSGLGCFECSSAAEATALPRRFEGPLLVQKKVDGTVLDMSAIYLEGELVHFSYAKFERTMWRRGPSSVRTYYPLSMVPGAVFDEVARLGRALGAHGFCNITCIDAADGSGRTYIEADMRPNAWADYSRYYGEDAAARIRDWQATRKVLTKDTAASPPGQGSLLAAHFMNVNVFELLINRFGVWRFVPRADPELMRRMIAVKVIRSILNPAKELIPQRLRPGLKHALVTAHLLPP